MYILMRTFTFGVVIKKERDIEPLIVLKDK